MKDSEVIEFLEKQVALDFWKSRSGGFKLQLWNSAGHSIGLLRGDTLKKCIESAKEAKVSK